MAKDKKYYQGLMKKFNLKDMVGGWFVGNFEPSVLKQDCEVAVKYYKAGDKDKKHHHKEAVELTVIIKGKVRMGNSIYQDGDIILVDPNESIEFECIEDCINVVFKNKSVKGDKYFD